MKNWATVCGFVLLAGAVVGGCNTEKKPIQATTPPSSASPGGTEGRGLAGTEWSLEEIAGKPATANSRATLNFANSTSVAGNGSCNRFTGSVDIQGASIKFGPLAATRMLCDPDTSRQENEYLKALAEVERYEIKDRLTLYLYPKDSVRGLKFRAVL